MVDEDIRAAALPVAHPYDLALLPMLGIRSWRVANPMVFTSNYMTRDMKSYLESRFAGTDMLPKLVDSALRASVAELRHKRSVR